MKRIHLFNLAVVILSVSCLFADTTYKVDCNNGDTIQAALNAIKNSGGGRATIDIYGTCKERVSIRDFDRLTLVGHDGATIQFGYIAALPAVGIGNSAFVTIKNLTITGGWYVVECTENSVCRLENNQLMQGHDYGILIARSQAILVDNAVLKNGINGLLAQNGATVLSLRNLFTENGAAGVLVIGSNVVLQNDSIDFNQGQGVLAFNNSTLRVYDATITNNAGNGIQLESASTVQFSIYDEASKGTLIGGNSGHGVLLLDQANVSFSNLDIVIGSIQQPDVSCKGRSPSLRMSSSSVEAPTVQSQTHNRNGCTGYRYKPSRPGAPLKPSFGLSGIDTLNESTTRL